MTKTRILYLLRLFVSLLILIAIGRMVGWHDIGARLRQTRVEWILAMYGMALAAFTMNVLMLHALLTRVGLKIRPPRVALANCLGTFYTLILPGDMLAGLAKWADLSAATGDKPRVLSALLFAKVGLALPPLVIGSVALALRNPFPSSGAPDLALLVALLLVTGTILALNRRSGPTLDSWIERSLRRFPKSLQSRAFAVVRAAADFRTLTVLDKLLIMGLSTLSFFFGIMAMSCAVRAVGASVALHVLAWVAMTLFITRLVPISLSNLGVREGVMVAVFGLYGVAPATAVLVGLITFTNTLLFALVGAGYQVALVSGRVAWRRP